VNRPSVTRLFSRKRIAAVAAGALLSTFMVGVVTAQGEPTKKVRFNDSSVWDADRSRGQISHWNTAVEVSGVRLQAGRRREKDLLSIEQGRAGIVVLNRSTQSISVLNDRDQKIVDTQLKTTADAVVRVGVEAVYVIEPSKGRVLRIPAKQLETATSLDGYLLFDAGKSLVAELGVDGSLHVLVPATGVLRTFKPDGSAGKETTFDKVSATSTVSAIGQTGVVLDPDASELRVGNKRIPIGKRGLQLAMPTAWIQSVYVVDQDGAIFPVALDGAVGDGLPAVGGSPIRPLVQVDGTVIGVSQGTGTQLVQRQGESPSLKPEYYDPGHELQGRLIFDRGFIDDVDSPRIVMIRDDGEVVPFDGQAPDDQNADKSGDEGEERSSTEDGDTKAEENEPPTAVDDSLRVRPDRTSLLPVLANDTDPNSDDLTVVAVTGLNVGADVATVSLALGGTGVVFSPSAGFRGSVSFQVTISDPDGETDTGEVDVTVDGLRNDPPVPRPDEAKATVDRASLIDVLANDLDPDGDNISLASVRLDSGEGSVAIGQSGLVSFLPTADGESLISYTVQDEQGLNTEGKLTVVASSQQNLAPIAREDLFEVALGSNQTLPLLANDIDPDGGYLQLVKVPTSVAPLGSLQTDGNLVRFTALQVGRQSFFYEVSDGTDVVRAKVRLIVSQRVLNRPPLAIPDRVSVTPGVEATVDVLANDSDPDGDVIGVVSWTTPEGVTVRSADGRRLVVSVDDALTLTPSAVVYEVSDGSQTVTGTLLVSPTPELSDLPPIAIADQFGVRAGASRSLPVLRNDVDPEGGSLLLKALVGAPDGLTISANQKLIQLDGKASAESFDFSYEVVDTLGNSALAQVTIESVSNPESNRPPSVQPDRATVRSGQVASLPVLSNDDDLDGDTLTITDAGLPSKGVVTVVGGVIKYQANPGALGTDKFIYSLNDGHGGVAVGEVSIGILPAPKSNQAPIAVDDGPRSVDASGTITVDVLANDSDPDKDPIRITSVEAISGGTASIGPNGQLIFVASDKTGPATVRYTISDSASATASAVVRFAVTKPKAVGVPPVARPDAATVPVAGATVVVNVLDNDVDPDGDRSTLKIASVSGKGVTILPDQQRLEIISGAQPVSVQYVVRDQQGNTSATSVTITVDPAAGLLIKDDEVQVRAGKSIDIDVLANDSAPTGNRPLRVVKVGSSDAGTASVVSGASIRFDAKASFSGKASFAYTVRDSLGNERSANVRVTVTGANVANKPPLARAGGPITIRAGTSESLDLSSLTKDPEGAKLTFAVGEVPTQIEASLQGSVLNISAPANAIAWNGLIAYAVTDSEGSRVVSQIVIRVVPATASTTSFESDPVIVSTTQSAVVAPGNSGAPSASSVARTTRNLVGTPPTVRPTPNQPSATPPNSPPSPTRQGSPNPVTTAATDPTPTVTGSATSVSSPATSVAPTSATTVPLSTSVARTTASTATTALTTTSTTSTIPSSTSSSTSVPAKPGAPSGLSASNVTQTAANLTWSAPSSGGSSAITRYEIAGVGATTINAGAALSFSASGLTPNRGYTLTVTACNAAGCGPASAAATFTTGADTQVPGAPTGVAAGSITPNGASISWSAPATNGGSPITRYEIGGLPTSPINAGTGLSHVATGLVANTSYNVTVKACNQIGCSTAGTSLFKSLASASVPGAPGPAIATNVGPNGADLSWAQPSSAGSSPILSYKVAVTLSGQPGVREITVAGLSTLIGQLWPFAQYSVVVRACNSAGCSAPSAEATFITDKLPPPEPVGLMAEVTSSTSVILSWTHGTRTLRDQDRSPSFEVRVGVLNPQRVAGTSLVLDNLLPNTSYSFEVRACGTTETNCSSWSTPFAFVTRQTTTTTGSQVPGVPGPPVATAVTQTTATLSWTAPTSPGSSPITKYEIAGLPAKLDTPGALTAGATGLSAATAYSVTVRACNAAGCGAASAPVTTFTTLAIVPPSIPAGLAVSITGPTTATLTWSASTAGTNPVTGYDLQAVGFPVTPAGLVTTFGWAGLTPKTSYTWQVRGCSGTVCSAWSAGIGGTTQDLPPRVPGQPTGAAAIDASQTALRINWAQPADQGYPGPVTGYRIHIANVKFVEGVPAPNHVVDGLAPGTTYSFQIAACNSNGCGEFGPFAQGRTLDPPPPPSIPAVDRGTLQTRCGFSPCWSLVVRARNFAPNTTYTVVCFPGTSDQISWNGYTTDANGNGDFDMNGRCWGGRNITISASINGVTGSTFWGA
jgi:large repetitive protein